MVLVLSNKSASSQLKTDGGLLDVKCEVECNLTFTDNSCTCLNAIQICGYFINTLNRKTKIILCQLPGPGVNAH